MDNMPQGTGAAYSPAYVPSKRYTRLGLWFIFAPLAALLLVGITAVIILTSSKNPLMMISVLTVLAGIALITFVILASIGVVLIFRKEPAAGVSFDPRSGTEMGEMPNEIKGWNWGAAFTGHIWGIYHGVWICLLGYIPFVNLVWWIVMGIKGNEWAWKKGKWQSPAQFNDAQWGWNRAGIAMFGYIMFVVVVEVVVMILTFTMAASLKGNMGDDSFGRYMNDSPYNYMDDTSDIDMYGDDSDWYSDTSTASDALKQ